MLTVVEMMSMTGLPKAAEKKNCLSLYLLLTHQTKQLSSFPFLPWSCSPKMGFFPQRLWWHLYFVLHAFIFVQKCGLTQDISLGLQMWRWCLHPSIQTSSNRRLYHLWANHISFCYTTEAYSVIFIKSSNCLCRIHINFLVPIIIR